MKGCNRKIRGKGKQKEKQKKEEVLRQKVTESE
jgi:hypothetical protein